MELGQRSEVVGATIEKDDIGTVNEIIKMTEDGSWSKLTQEDRDKCLMQLNDIQENLRMKKK